MSNQNNKFLYVIISLLVLSNFGALALFATRPIPQQNTTPQTIEIIIPNIGVATSDGGETTTPDIEVVAPNAEVSPPSTAVMPVNSEAVWTRGKIIVVDGCTYVLVVCASMVQAADFEVYIPGATAPSGFSVILGGKFVMGNMEYTLLQARHDWIKVRRLS